MLFGSWLNHSVTLSYSTFMCLEYLFSFNDLISITSFKERSKLIKFYWTDYSLGNKESTIVTEKQSIH